MMVQSSTTAIATAQALFLKQLAVSKSIAINRLLTIIPLQEALRQFTNSTKTNHTDRENDDTGAKTNENTNSSNKSSLRRLNVSRNSLGFKAINDLQCVCQQNNIQLEYQRNYIFEEVLNSVSHGIGFLLSCLGIHIHRSIHTRICGLVCRDFFMNSCPFPPQDRSCLCLRWLRRTLNPTTTSGRAQCSLSAYSSFSQPRLSTIPSPCSHKVRMMTDMDPVTYQPITTVILDSFS